MRRLFMALAILCVSSAFAVTIEVVPAAPSAFEPVHLRVTYPYEPFYSHFLRDTEVTMAFNVITVVPTTYVELAATASYDVFLGKLPGGNYKVQFYDAGVPVNFDFTVGPRAASEQASSAPSRSFSDINGLWSAPGEPGWGVSIAHGPSNDFVATWFAHDVAGKPVWYSIQSASWSANYFSGDVYEVTGPYFGGPLADTARGRRVGSGGVSVRDADNISFFANVDGVQVTKQLTRMKLR